MNTLIMSEIEKVESREDLASFIQQLRGSMRDSAWANRDLQSYREAMAAWISALDGYFENKGEPCPEQPSWKTVAQILVASAIYE